MIPAKKKEIDCHDDYFSNNSWNEFKSIAAQLLKWVACSLQSNSSMKTIISFITIFFATISSTYAGQSCKTAVRNKFKSAYITIEGVKYHYIAKGDKKKPMVLFLHGFPEFSSAWQDQLNHFSSDHYAVAVDMKGANLTDRPAGVENYTAQKLAKEIGLFASAVSDKPYYLVGHDWGATIAWNVAFQQSAQSSQKLLGLVTINGAHSIQYFREYHNNPEQFSKADYVRKIISGEYTDQHYLGNNFAELRKQLINNEIGESQFYFNEQTIADYISYWSIPGAFDAGLNYYRAIKIPPPELFKPENPKPPHLNPLFASFHTKIPTLVLWGEKDAYIVPEVLNGLENFVPNLKVVRYPENSHWIVHENPKEISKQIREFLKGL